MSILNDDLMSSWGDDLLVALISFTRQRTPEAFQVVRDIVRENCKYRSLRMQWNKHKYIALSLGCPKHDMHTYDGPKIIITGVTNPAKQFATQTWFYTSTKDGAWKIDGWHEEWRTYDNPIISTTAYFAQYEKYILPDDAFNILLNGLKCEY